MARAILRDRHQVIVGLSLPCHAMGAQQPVRPRSSAACNAFSEQVFSVVAGSDGGTRGPEAGVRARTGSGADTRIRTEDLLFTKQLLYR